jgi:hypothetical protein
MPITRIEIPVINIVKQDITIPDGYRFVRFDQPKRGEKYLQVHNSVKEYFVAWVDDYTEQELINHEKYGFKRPIVERLPKWNWPKELGDNVKDVYFGEYTNSWMGKTKSGFAFWLTNGEESIYPWFVPPTDKTVHQIR